MKQIRKRLTYANVMSSIAVFLILGGATAFAAIKKVGANEIKANSIKTGKIVKEAVTAGKLKKKAVTESKLADGAVTTGKLADNSVTGPKLADNSVSGPKIVDGSVSGADISAGSTPFSQIVAKVRGTIQVPFTASTVYPFNNPTYTQNAGEDNQFIGALNVNFAATCNPPRSATAYLLVDAANPAVPTVNDLAGLATVSETTGGAVTRQAEFVALVGAAGMSKFAPNANTQHTFSVFLASSSCNTGSGVSAGPAGVDVIGTK